MTINFCSLSSGSSGNCYYLGNDFHGILIDAGISAGAIRKFLRNMGISNNILLYNLANSGGLSTNVTFYNVDNCFISNNIIFRNWGGASWIYSLSDLNTFSNNIFSVVPNHGNNTFVGNYNSVDLTTVFVDQSGNTFNYSHNYHLVNPSAYLGIDNTQVGVYGGMYPVKEGAVPQNPHIQVKTISPTTDTNGDLQIQIQVEAQEN